MALKNHISVRNEVRDVIGNLVSIVYKEVLEQ